MLQVPKIIREDLLDESSVKRILRQAVIYPEFFSSLQVYEMHLSGSRPRVDLSTLVRNTEGDRMSFLQWVIKGKGLYPSEIWEPLYNFSRTWHREPDRFGHIMYLWLEFDVPVSATAIPAPSLVAGFEPGISPSELFREVLNLSEFLPLNRKNIEYPLRKILKAFEAHTATCSFSYMLSRKPRNAFRLILDANDATAMDLFTDLPANTETEERFTRLARQLCEQHPGNSRMEINIDERGLLADRAIHQFTHFHPETVPSVLQWLYDEGVCDNRKMQAVKHFFENKTAGTAGNHVDMLAIKLLYHAAEPTLTSKAYVRHIRNVESPLFTPAAPLLVT